MTPCAGNLGIHFGLCWREEPTTTRLSDKLCECPQICVAGKTRIPTQVGAHLVANRITQLVSILSAAVLMATGLAAVAVTPAHAAGHVIDHCYGHRVNKWELGATSHNMGRLELWYSHRSGGTSCVMVYDERKGRHFMKAQIAVGKHKYHTDKGRYRYFAGGVRIKHTNGKCIAARGAAGWKGSLQSTSVGRLGPRSGDFVHRC